MQKMHSMQIISLWFALQLHKMDSGSYHEVRNLFNATKVLMMHCIAFGTRPNIAVNAKGGDKKDVVNKTSSLVMCRSTI